MLSADANSPAGTHGAPPAQIRQASVAQAASTIGSNAPADSGTVIVHDTGSSTGPLPAGALELTDMFAPSSLERLFQPLSKLQSHRQQSEQQQNRAGRSPLGISDAHAHQQRTPLAAVFGQQSGSQSWQRPLQQKVAQNKPENNAGQKQSPRDLSTDTQPAAALPTRLLRGTDDTWTRGQFSALMSALEAPDDDIQHSTSHSMHPDDSVSGSGSGSRKSVANSSSSGSILQPLPDPRMALDQPPARSNEEYNRSRSSAATDTRMQHNAPNYSHLLRHVMPAFDTSVAPAAIGSLEINNSANSGQPNAAPVAESLTSLQQISSQLYPDDIDFLTDLEEVANSGGSDRHHENVLSRTESKQQDRSVSPIQQQSPQHHHQHQNQSHQHPDNSLPPRFQSNPRSEFRMLGRHLPERVHTLASSNMSSHPALSTSLEEAAADIRKTEHSHGHNSDSDRHFISDNSISVQHVLQHQQPHERQTASIPKQNNDNKSAEMDRLSQRLQNNMDFSRDSATQTDLKTYLHPTPITKRKNAKEAETPRTATKSTMTVADLPVAAAVQHAVDQSIDCDVPAVTPKKIQTYSEYTNTPGSAHTMQSPFGHAVDLSRRGLSMLRGTRVAQDRPRCLQLSDNALTYLNDVPSSVETLYLSHNRISNITSFSHLRALRFVDVSRNDLSDLSALACLSSLRELDASFNRIDDVQSILRLPSLMKINLKHNLIASIDFQASNLPRLVSFNVSYNRIRHIKNVHRLENLQELDLSFNLLRSFAPSRILRKLKSLDLAFNRVLAFSGTSFPSLKNLILDGNRITEVDDVEELCSLEVLSIESQMTDDQPLCLSGFETLREIRIADNVPGDLTRTFGKYLESFDCRDAQLDTIPPSLTTCVDSLCRIVLCGNGIRDISPLSGLISLQELDVSRNMIWDIGPVLMTLKRLPSLRSFDMRFNPITEQFYGTIEMQLRRLDRLREGDDGCLAGVVQRDSGTSHDDDNRYTNNQVDAYPAMQGNNDNDALNAKMVREICYRSSVISAIGRTVEMLDQMPVSREDRHQARRRIRALKEFLQTHRQKLQQKRQIQQQPYRSLQAHSFEDGYADLNDNDRDGAEQSRHLLSSSMNGRDPELLPTTAADPLGAPPPQFAGWVPESFPLGDITADDRLFVDVQSMLQIQQQLMDA